MFLFDWILREVVRLCRQTKADLESAVKRIEKEREWGKDG